jgi:hypothetical protein
MSAIWTDSSRGELAAIDSYVAATRLRFYFGVAGTPPSVTVGMMSL